MKRLVCIILMCFLFVAAADGASVSRQKKKTVRTEQSAGKKNSKKQTRKAKTSNKQTSKNDRSRKSVESERKRTKEQIRQTQEQIRRNNERTNRQLNALSSLNGQIKTHRDEISAIQATIDTIDSRAAILADTISRAETDVKRLREHCKRSLRQARRSRQAMTETNLVFSSKTFTEGAKRVSYLRQLERWRAKKTTDLRQGIEILSNKKKALGMLREKHSASLAQLSEEKQQLETKQASTKLLVDSLRRQGKSLQSVLAERQRQARALDAELDRIIEEEARRAAEEQRRAEEARIAAQRQKDAARVDASSDAVTPPAVDPAKKNAGKGKDSRDAKKTEYPGRADEERRLSGSFVSNKGRLLFPVAGKYNITSYFGRNSHSELSRVEINNPGIDIEVPAGSSARAVFDGTVSYIFRMDGYQNVVMVRHGSYLTVYAHIDGLSVKKGDKVKAGQSLGSIFADPTNGGRATLHFEVRNEREKLNPLQWVR